MIRLILLITLLLASCRSNNGNHTPATATSAPTILYQSQHGLTFVYPDHWFVVEEYDGRRVMITNTEAVAAGEDPRLFDDVFMLRLFPPASTENSMMGTGVAVSDPLTEVLWMFSSTFGVTTFAAPVRRDTITTGMVGNTPAAWGTVLDLYVEGIVYVLDFGPETRVVGVLLVSDLAQYETVAHEILASLACCQ